MLHPAVYSSFADFVYFFMALEVLNDNKVQYSYSLSVSTNEEWLIGYILAGNVMTRIQTTQVVIEGYKCKEKSSKYQAGYVLSLNWKFEGADFNMLVQSSVLTYSGCSIILAFWPDPAYY